MIIYSIPALRRLGSRPDAFCESYELSDWYYLCWFRLPRGATLPTSSTSITTEPDLERIETATAVRVKAVRLSNGAIARTSSASEERPGPEPVYPPSTSEHHACFGAVNLRYTRFGKVSSGDLDAEERPASVIRLLRSDSRSRAPMQCHNRVARRWSEAYRDR